jgi:hypothetical protein
MQQIKKCRFCKKVKKKFFWYFMLSLYLIALVVMGQISLIKSILNLF